jgi:hypothetical protein
MEIKEGDEFNCTLKVVGVCELDAADVLTVKIEEFPVGYDEYLPSIPKYILEKAFNPNYERDIKLREIEKLQKRIEELKGELNS